MSLDDVGLQVTCDNALSAKSTRKLVLYITTYCVRAVSRMTADSTTVSPTEHRILWSGLSLRFNKRETLQNKEEPPGKTFLDVYTDREIDVWLLHQEAGL